MLFKIKRWLLLLVTVSITFYMLWMIVQKVSPVINPPKNSQVSIELDYRGAIKFDIKGDYKNPSDIAPETTKLSRQ